MKHEEVVYSMCRIALPLWKHRPLTRTDPTTLLSRTDPRPRAGIPGDARLRAALAKPGAPVSGKPDRLGLACPWRAMGCGLPVPCSSGHLRMDGQPELFQLGKVKDITQTEPI